MKLSLATVEALLSEGRRRDLAVIVLAVPLRTQPPKLTPEWAGFVFRVKK